ncbi:MAG: hypothetical protein AAGD38_20755, partial [Acidobacteriota bacterium]
NDDGGAVLQLDCPALPTTTATGTITTGILDYDIFAWNSFIALNWPALVPSSYNQQRGFPDTDKSFASAAPGDLTVWETYKEKREVFLADPFTGEPVTNPQVQPWNAAPQYGPASQQVPTCPGSSTLVSGFERHISHVLKLNSTFDTLDETAEVSSEARESDSVLCQGHSPNCGVQGKPVGPRVWLNRGGTAYPVLYEVKVNWDFYDYLANFSGGPLWVQANARAAAPQATIRLPARTSGSAAPPHPGTALHKGGVTPAPVSGPNPIVTDYSALACMSQAEVVKLSPTRSITPCPAGSVHLKAAWILLDGPSDDYHTTTAYYYRDYSPQAGQPGYPSANKCKAPATYGLIGLHIIQRIHHLVEGRYVHAPGGTFVYATWEHTSNDTETFTYANLYPTTSSTPRPYPNVDPTRAIPLKRAYAPLATTENANNQVHRALGCTGGSGDSVWCHYKLIGTQYLAANGPPTGFDVDNPPDVLPSSPQPGIEYPPNSGQPYFLANLVVESNVALQQFLGSTPRLTPIDHYANPRVPPGGSGRVGKDGVPANSTSGFDLSGANLAFRIAPRSAPAEGQHKSIIHGSIKNGTNGSKDGRKVGAHNMGGCMGCHGVSQLNGYSFSFVLLGNQQGGVPDTLTEVDIPPPPLND